jgi:hypothetical protein
MKHLAEDETKVLNYQAKFKDGVFSGQKALLLD